MVLKTSIILKNEFYQSGLMVMFSLDLIIIGLSYLKPIDFATFNTIEFYSADGSYNPSALT